MGLLAPFGNGRVGDAKKLAQNVPGELESKGTPSLLTLPVRGERRVEERES